MSSVFSPLIQSEFALLAEHRNRVSHVLRGGQLYTHPVGSVFAGFHP